jgi:hypothetical protein
MHHEDFAIQARIEVGTVTVFRIDHDILVLLDDIEDMQFDAQLFGNPQRIVAFGFGLVLFTDGVCMTLHTKTGEEIKTFDMNTLFQDDFCSQQ